MVEALGCATGPAGIKDEATGLLLRKHHSLVRSETADRHWVQLQGTFGQGERGAIWLLGVAALVAYRKMIWVIRGHTPSPTQY